MYAVTIRLYSALCVTWNVCFVESGLLTYLLITNMCVDYTHIQLFTSFEKFFLNIYVKNWTGTKNWSNICTALGGHIYMHIKLVITGFKFDMYNWNLQIPWNLLEP
jgi:hypothetical protein